MWRSPATPFGLCRPSGITDRMGGWRYGCGWSLSAWPTAPKSHAGGLVELVEGVRRLEVLLHPALNHRGGLLDLRQLTDHLTDGVEGDVDGLIGLLVRRGHGESGNHELQRHSERLRVVRVVPRVGPVVAQHPRRLAGERAAAHRVAAARLHIGGLLDRGVLS